MHKVNASPFAFTTVALFAAASTACSANNGGDTSGSGGSGSTSQTTANTTVTGTGGGFNFDGGTTTGPGLDSGCAATSIKADLLPANLLFLIDRSGSMNCNLPPITTSQECEANPVKIDMTQPSKWEVIITALKSALGALPPTASAGITYFSTDDACGVQSAPHVPVFPLSAAHLSALQANLDIVQPLGATPIVGGTILAYKHLHQQAILAGNKFVVLITDGADTCNPEAFQTFLGVEIPKALSVNIRTFAIGAPGSEPARAFLSQIAFEGGTPKDAACDHSAMSPDVGDCHFDMTTSQNFSADLSAALAAVSGKALTCEFDVPEGQVGQEVDFGFVNVDYTPGNGSPVVPILQDNTAPCDQGAEGWQYTQNHTKIVLCGAICNIVKGDPNAKIDIVLGCETKVK
jgi:hypothetical protein